MAEYVPSTAASSSSRTDNTSEGTPVEKWTCDALKAYLKSRGLTYSGLRKAELVAKYVLTTLSSANFNY